VWGLGLGCNGAIEVFVEPAEGATWVVHALRSALEDERPICVVTVVESDVPDVDPGARLLVRPGGSPGDAAEGSLGDAALDRAAADAGAEQLGIERSEVRSLDGSSGSARCFVEVLEPPLRLLVCGAGHDAAPLVAAAAQLGWRPIVVDDRPAFLTPERLPHAAGFVAVSEPSDAASAAKADEHAFAIVMTHNFLKDKDYVRSLLPSPVPYLALLGPGARSERLLAELAEEGVRVGEVERARVHAPAGLDLGSETPEEIAQAVVAEIVAVRRGRGGGFLRDRRGPIHDRVAQARAAGVTSHT
jgi:xanthine dehydrogenase accessory factor